MCVFFLAEMKVPNCKRSKRREKATDLSAAGEASRRCGTHSGCLQDEGSRSGSSEIRLEEIENVSRAQQKQHVS